jgi:hypothetical protein
LEALLAKKTRHCGKGSVDDKWADLNFKVTAEFHRQYKLAAALWDMSMKEVLEKSFRLIQERLGSPYAVAKKRGR